MVQIVIMDETPINPMPKMHQNKIKFSIPPLNETADPYMERPTTDKNPLVTANAIPSTKLSLCISNESSLPRWLDFKRMYPRKAPMGWERPPSKALTLTAFNLANALGDDEKRKYNGKHIRKPSVKL